MADDEVFKAGDVCFDCQQLGITKYLRYFKINLNGDTLLKCESNECMYPYNDEFSSTDEEEPDEETNSIKFIDDLLQQIKNETAEQNSTNSGSENINKNTEDDKYNSTEMDTHFEISFFDTFEEIVNENLSQPPNLEIETKDFAKDSKTNIPSLPLIDTDVIKQAASQPIDKFDTNKNELLSSMPSLFDCDGNKQEQSFSLPSLLDTGTQSQPKINIQSIETIKTSQLNENNVFPSTKTQPNVSTRQTVIPAATTSSESLVENVKPVVKTKARRKPNVSINRTSKDPHESKANLSAESGAPPIETKTFAIPKANIMKGSDFLKKLAVIDKKTPKYNIKCKEARKRATNKQQKADNNLSRNEDTKDTEFKRDKQEINFSLEAIAQLLKSNKNKNAN